MKKYIKLVMLFFSFMFVVGGFTSCDIGNMLNGNEQKQEINILFMVDYEVYHKTTVKAGDVIIIPDDPVKEGYEFIGWYSNTDLTIEFDLKNISYTQNIVVYSKFEKIEEEKIKVKLDTPTVAINDEGLAIWNEITNATKYAYIINDATEVETTTLSIQLNNGDTIKVKAFGDGINYTDSDWSVSLTYSKTTESEIKTISIVEAITIGKDLESGMETNEKYKIIGSVGDIINTTYGQMTIVDNDGVKLRIYSLYSENGTRFDQMEKQPKVGDEIVVVSSVGNHMGEPQLKKATLISINNSKEEQPEDNNENVIVRFVTSYSYDEQTNEIVIESSRLMSCSKGKLPEIKDLECPNKSLFGDGDVYLESWLYVDDETLELKEWTDENILEKDIVLYAKWNARYIVTFVDYAGNEIGMQEIDYSSDREIIFPDIEAPDGCKIVYKYKGIEITTPFYLPELNNIDINCEIVKIYNEDNNDNYYTYNTYESLLPTNWNELTYQDANDSTLVEYLKTPFFTYNYKLDWYGNIIPGDYVVEYAAATKLEDVTTTYAGKYAVPEEATNSYAYKITLRNDLKWDDGTPISAEDFVYTMQQQLDPLFQNYRADNFIVGPVIIHNAQNYLKQKTTGKTALASFMQSKGYTTINDLLAAEGSVQTFINWNYSFGAKYENGEWTYAEIQNEIVASKLTVAEMYKLFLDMFGADQTQTIEYFMNETYVEYTYPELNWKDVGFFQGDNKYEIIMILDKPLVLINEDDSLSYKAVYKFGGLPLVKKDLYEACKQEPQSGSALWTTSYSTSVETSASWGPYKLTYHNNNDKYTLERNENWWGYNQNSYAGQYMTDKIECKLIENYDDAFLMFKQGKIDSVSIESTIADTYKYSGQAVFTPDDYVGSLQLQSSYEALKSRETAEYNKTLLSYKKFRKALSLAINRTEYNNLFTTASKPAFGLFGSMHYYDVENGKVYRNEDVAKQVLCDIYGVDVSKHPNLDWAYKSITGYNLTQARILVDEAIAEAVAAGDYTEGKKVRLTLGSSNPTTTRSLEYIRNAWDEMVKGTKLEGLLEFEINQYVSNWINDFRAGKYDVCIGGWSGVAWDPGYLLLAYLSPDYMYSSAWDTYSHMMKFDVNGDKHISADENLSLMDWYYCLNGQEGYPHDWSSEAVEESKRLTLIAALEKEILSVYYTVPLQNNYSAALISYKWEYASREYNTFMDFGGLRYITYNYTDEEWIEFCQENNYNIDYTK